ncbi:hypothetical protein MKY41_10415 [Sporosarcina sp. FSL W7-1349]|uniref:dual OB domain-containing protein n=1 Tax=Sporosarcina sp. FSL W7-1349 TaxID=2921561 RepID=UPI0030FCCEE8
MNKTFRFLILAVTKTYGGYCIAGMDKKGKWIRPLPVGAGKFWGISLDANNTSRYIKVGDVWEISQYEKEYDPTSPGHTEDIRLKSKPIYIGSLSNDQLVKFVNNHQECKEELELTLNADSRSLCLIKASEFRNFMDRSTYDGRESPRMTFEFQGKTYRNTTTSTTGFPITDLKWRAYTIQRKETQNNFDDTFICIGLARIEKKKNITREYPMVISVITNPEVPLLPTYPN